MPPGLEPQVGDAAALGAVAGSGRGCLQTRRQAQGVGGCTGTRGQAEESTRGSVVQDRRVEGRRRRRRTRARGLKTQRREVRRHPARLQARWRTARRQDHAA